MGEGHLDRDLVQRVQKGDKNAFDLLVRKYQYKIIKLISRYVHDPSEALDVSQEAFLKAYRALPGFRGDSAFYTWLYRIAINTAKNYLVAQGRRPPGSDIDAQEAEQYEGQSLLKEYETPNGCCSRMKSRRPCSGQSRIYRRICARRSPCGNSKE